MKNLIFLSFFKILRGGILHLFSSDFRFHQGKSQWLFEQDKPWRVEAFLRPLQDARQYLLEGQWKTSDSLYSYSVVFILLFSFAHVKGVDAHSLEKDKQQTKALVQQSQDVKVQEDARALLADFGVKGCACADNKTNDKKSSCSPMNKNISFPPSPPNLPLGTNLKLIVFASLSMPEGSLKSLARDLHKIGGRLVLRGLFHNSFAQTRKLFQKLNISAEIDPFLFETYGIKDVPSFLMVKEFSDEKQNLWDIVRGNISVMGALDIFAQKGQFQDFSRNLMKK